MTSFEGKVEKSRDGVPAWNGEAGTFQSYEEAALQWEQGIQWGKRYLCGPRLISGIDGNGKAVHHREETGLG